MTTQHKIKAFLRGMGSVLGWDTTLRKPWGNKTVRESLEADRAAIDGDYKRASLQYSRITPNIRSYNRI